MLVLLFCGQRTELQMNGKLTSWILGKHEGICASSGRISCRHGMYSYLKEVTISGHSC